MKAMRDMTLSGTLVIRPGSVVEMSHCHVLRVCLRQLHIRERVATNRVGHQCKMRGGTN